MPVAGDSIGRWRLVAPLGLHGAWRVGAGDLPGTPFFGFWTSGGHSPPETDLQPLGREEHEGTTLWVYAFDDCELLTELVMPVHPGLARQILRAQDASPPPGVATFDPWPLNRRAWRRPRGELLRLPARKVGGPPDGGDDRFRRSLGSPWDARFRAPLDLGAGSAHLVQDDRAALEAERAAKWRVAAAGGPGSLRDFDEDAWAWRAEGEALVVAVADGLGGYQSGDRASWGAACAFVDEPGATDPSARHWLDRACNAAQRTVAAVGGDVGASLVGARFADDHGEIGWSGDCRAYLLRGGELRCLTRDHTLVEQMVATGRLSRVEAERHPHRHILIRCLGPDRPPGPQFETAQIALRSGDRLLLCTDGLHGSVPRDTLATLLASGSVRDAARRLNAAAIAAFSTDNVALVVMECK